MPKYRVQLLATSKLVDATIRAPNIKGLAQQIQRQYPGAELVSASKIPTLKRPKEQR